MGVPLQRHLLTCRLERLLQSKCNCPWGLLAASLPIFGFKKGSLSMHQLWRLLSLVQKYDSSLQRPEVGPPFLHRPPCWLAPFAFLLRAEDWNPALLQDIAVILPYCCEFGVWPSSDVLRAVFTSLTSASATHDRLLPAVYVDVFWSFAQFWLCASKQTVLSLPSLLAGAVHCPFRGTLLSMSR